MSIPELPNDGDDDTSIDINLRPANTVATRLLILGAVLRRMGADAASLPDQYGELFDLREWLRAQDLWGEATSSERGLFLQPASSPLADDHPGLALIAESVTTLAWTMGLTALHGEDAGPDVAALLDNIPGPWEKSARWIASKSLRPESEIATLRETTEIWHWRLEIEPFRRVASGSELVEIEESIREVTRDGVIAGLLVPGKEGGFSLSGIPLPHIDDDDLADVVVHQAERLRSLNWVCGFGSGWDNVPLDV